MAVLEAGGTAEQAELAAMSVISAKNEAALKQLQAEQPEAYAELGTNRRTVSIGDGRVRAGGDSGRVGRKNINPRIW